MKVKHIPCGRFVNESERKAVHYFEKHIPGIDGNGCWYLLTNMPIGYSANELAKEVDIIAIGPTGVFVIEVKHWDAAYIKSNSKVADNEANKIHEKAKVVASLLRKQKIDAGFITPRFIFTENEKDTKLGNINGVEVFGLKELPKLLSCDATDKLSDNFVEDIYNILKPKFAVDFDEKIRTFEKYINLEPVNDIAGDYHKVYKGFRSGNKDKVILHIYDLTLSNDKEKKEKAEREFNVLQKLQKSSFTSRIYDSFQDSSVSPGEICFFAVVDSNAPTLSERSKDKDWAINDRISFASNSIKALLEMHTPDPTLNANIETIMHRNLTPETIRVYSNNQPLFTELHFSKLGDGPTVTGNVADDFKDIEQYVDPNVLSKGRAGYTLKADIYALCASLKCVFANVEDTLAKSAIDILDKGMAKEENARPELGALESQMQSLLKGKVQVQNKDLSVSYWDENTVKELNGKFYKIFEKLGSGSIGYTFKVTEVSGDDAEEPKSGPYVGKAIVNSDMGKKALNAYGKARPHVGGDNLANILETANEWKENELNILLKWIPGNSLNDLKGILPLYLDEVSDAPLQDTLLELITNLCDGLDNLHKNSLVHGDISPKNIIVNKDQLVLTDYDLSAPIGSIPSGGTPNYCSPEVDIRQAVQCSDDIYALAATIFDVLFERYPFQYPEGLNKTKGLNWTDIQIDEWDKLVKFLNKAASPNQNVRFENANEAKLFIDKLLGYTPPEVIDDGSGSTTAGDTDTTEKEAPAVVERNEPNSNNEVPWLKLLLQTYPGSKYSNIETRGLDSEFSMQTYIETDLDRIIKEQIQKRDISLLILCGNAGDGKTAFLQNLAKNLDCPQGKSEERLWDFTTPDGLRIRANLDGSASFREKSAQQLLDEIFEPFHNNDFPKDTVHLLAVNDGPLYAWLQEQEDTYLVNQLDEALENGVCGDKRIRFIDLNNRSLVGALGEDDNQKNNSFLYQLIDKMLGNDETWKPCETCIAQNVCHANSSVILLKDSEIGVTIRERLKRALQAVHQKGELHITARSIRAAVSYIFFGTNYCSDYQNNNDIKPYLYYDRAFDMKSEARQGDLLKHLEFLDPAIECHPVLDRYLISDETEIGLASLRRKAYFEWDKEKIIQIGRSENAIDLARAKYLDDFMLIGSGTDEDRERICINLCEGISRLENLPRNASKTDIVPLKITPRTPTETAFWVNKDRKRFSLKPEENPKIEGLDMLHTHAILTYKYENGDFEELIIGADLFYFLMELKEGYQFSDAQSDDTFANLSIFKQRLTQEGDKSLRAWNPRDDGNYDISAELYEHNQMRVITLKEIPNE